MSLLQAVRECGWSAHLSLLLGSFGALTSLAALTLLATPQRRWVWLVSLAPLLFALLSLGSGEFGVRQGRNAVDQALSITALDAEQQQRLQTQGYSEAAQCRTVATRASALPLLLGFLALGLGLLVLKRPEQR